MKIARMRFGWVSDNPSGCYKAKRLNKSSLIAKIVKIKFVQFNVNQKEDAVGPVRADMFYERETYQIRVRRDQKLYAVGFHISVN